MNTRRYRTALTVIGMTSALVAAVAAPAEAATSTTRTEAQKRAYVKQVHVRAVHARAVRLAAQRKAEALAAARAAAATPTPTATPSSEPTLEPAPVVDPVVEATTEATSVPVPLAPVVDALPTLDPTSPSGVAAPRGDLPGWNQTYVEDFGTPVALGGFPGVYTNHWYAYADGVKDTSRNGTYMPSKVLSVHDGVLDYWIHSENGQHLVSAPVLKDTYHQSYGRYSVRFRSDSLPGYKNAWLLWPDSERWPTDGEIDFPEGNLDGTIHGFAHYASAAGGQDAFSTGASFRDWHTATIEWLPGKVTFVLDGKVIGSSTTNVPSTAMHWVLQTETALSGGAPSDSVSGHVLVDWVTLYERAV
jgi:hypothetical protein